MTWRSERGLRRRRTWHGRKSRTSPCVARGMRQGGDPLLRASWRAPLGGRAGSRRGGRTRRRNRRLRASPTQELRASSGTSVTNMQTWLISFSKSSLNDKRTWKPDEEPDVVEANRARYDIRNVSCGTSRMRCASYLPQRLSGHRRYALRSSGQRWAAWRAFWTTRRIQPDFGGKERRVSVTSHTRHTSLCRRVNTEELSNHSPRVTKMASIIALIPENSHKFMSSIQCILLLAM